MSLAKESWKFGQPRFIDDGEDALYIEFPDRTVKYVPERTCKPVIAEDGANEGCRVCSECGRLYWSTPFCAYCGAKVVGE